MAGKAGLKDPEGVTANWKGTDPCMYKWTGITCNETTQLVTRVFLAGNKLSGTLQVEWSALSSLNILVLYNNNLSGTLPVEWSALSSLTLLTLCQNPNLGGCLPATWREVSTYSPCSSIAQPGTKISNGTCSP